MKVSLGRYQVNSCREYVAALSEHGVDAELIEPPMDFFMSEGAAHYYSEILVEDVDAEFARLIIQGRESESQSRIENEIKPDIKRQLLQAVCFLLGMALLGWILFPYSESVSGIVAISIVIVVLVGYRILVARSNAKCPRKS